MTSSLSRARNSTIRRAGLGRRPAASPPHALFHTATLLPNGKVLVAGGYDGNSVALASAELYDPASGTWTATGSLATARDGHTATLLPNGKVLVAGGLDSSQVAFASAELYDPASGTWTATGSLATARYIHTATLLPNGKVLVAGGLTAAALLASAELYDPASGTWTATGSLATARYSHTATLLPNGKVLVAGGSDDSSSRARNSTIRRAGHGRRPAASPPHAFSHGDVAAQRQGARRRRLTAASSLLSRAQNSTTRRAGHGRRPAASQTHATVTRRPCCPTARCSPQAALTVLRHRSRKRGTLHKRRRWRTHAG